MKGTCHFCNTPGVLPGHDCPQCGARHKIYLVTDIYEGDDVVDWEIEEYGNEIKLEELQ
jgi:hypothetical protein